MNHTYKSVDGLTLNYMDQGTGLPVICLPGLTRNAQDFDYLVPHFPNIRIIRPDYRGRGKSDWADPATYTVPVEAGDILALMDHLDLEKAALLGTSRGGLIAMGLARAAKNRLLGVCLNDIGPVIEQTGLEDISAYLGRPPTQKNYDAAATAKAGFLTGFRNVPMTRWLEEVRNQYEQTDDGLSLRYDPRLRETVLATFAAQAPDLWPYFDALDGLPTALLRGETSDLLSRETANEMSKRRPDMLFTQVADRGHIPFLDEPESLELIRSWLGKMQ
ncbi:alpha/beta fold hydrolase [Falsihalocynthiibacter arcticus]|uniref:Hydrolase n=1 Tax=Falsihalocynthiibacter arcticus TaxID=1579316 RepID=A0A126UY40_9RHOB|nr:alpha/beta hydrolase [Falsihalocynthiibacter arcticus]AML50349.1 hydrolase [Falsihalocynthiibacter arcticus]